MASPRRRHSTAATLRPRHRRRPSRRRARPRRPAQQGHHDQRRPCQYSAGGEHPAIAQRGQRSEADDRAGTIAPSRRDRSLPAVGDPRAARPGYRDPGRRVPRQRCGRCVPRGRETSVRRPRRTGPVRAGTTQRGTACPGLVAPMPAQGRATPTRARRTTKVVARPRVTTPAARPRTKR